jgi:hypothetical protein
MEDLYPCYRKITSEYFKIWFISYKGCYACIKNTINMMLFKEIIAMSSGKYATK